MASYHILYSSGKDSNFQTTVEYHIPVPDQSNKANTTTLRAALANDADFDKTSTQASAEELTQLGTGELVKVTEISRLNENLPLASHRDKVRSRYDELVVEAVNGLRRKYAFLGFEETKGVDF